MTVAKKIKLPVTEKDRMMNRANNYPQVIHDRAALKAAIAIKNVYAEYDGVCGDLDIYFNQLQKNKEEFIPQGEHYKKFLLTFAFGETDGDSDGVIFEQKLDRFFYKDQMKLVEKLHAEVVHFNKAVKLKKNS